MAVKKLFSRRVNREKRLRVYQMTKDIGGRDSVVRVGRPITGRLLERQECQPGWVKSGGQILYVCMSCMSCMQYSKI